MHLLFSSTSYGVGVDYKGNVFFPDFKNGLIYKINKNFNKIKILRIENNKLEEISLLKLIIIKSIFKNFIGIKTNIYKPHDIYFDLDKNMYITQMGLGDGKGQGKVSVISKNNNVLYELAKFDKKKNFLIDPVMTYVKDNITYVSECGRNRILRFKKNKFIDWIGDDKSKNLNFINKKNLLFFVKLNKPHALKIGPDGKFYIVDTLNHRICRYSKKGKFLGWIGKRNDGKINSNWSIKGNSIKGKEKGAFNTPIDLILKKNFMIVSDCFNHRIVKISLSGKSLECFGESSDRLKNKKLSKTKGTSNHLKDNLGLSRPFGMKIWKDQLYIADKNNYRIKIIKSDIFNKNVV